jgi:hypothetical protein
VRASSRSSFGLLQWRYSEALPAPARIAILSKLLETGLGQLVQGVYLPGPMRAAWGQGHRRVARA